MLTYILKRIALMLPTLLGVLTVAFIVIQFVPGGPVEQLLAQARVGAGGAYKARGDTDEKQILAL
ncbi:MAG TPA: microcin ABC transporter permease, partial [Caldimonas sp.]